MKLYPLPGAAATAQAVILADGNYPAQGSVAAAILAAARCVVCCDGAADSFIARGGVPAAIVGDCDSLLPETEADYCGRIYRTAEQESNDLTKAFEWCLAQGLDDFIILGATGKREDHTIANVSLLAEYARRARVMMITDYGVFDAVAEDSRFGSFAGQQVSIFTIADDTPVAVEGLLYAPPAGGLCGWWRGSLNESAGDEFTIYTEGKTIVYRNFA